MFCVSVDRPTDPPHAARRDFLGRKVRLTHPPRPRPGTQSTLSTSYPLSRHCIRLGKTKRSKAFKSVLKGKGWYGGWPGGVISLVSTVSRWSFGDLGPSKSWSLSKITPRNRKIGWLIITPSGGGGVLISGQIYVLTIYVHIGVVNSGRHDSPHIRKSSLDHDSGGKNRGCQSVFQKYSTLLVFTSVTHTSPSLTASLAIIVPTRSPFFEISKSQKSEHDTLCVLSRPH